MAHGLDVWCWAQKVSESTSNAVNQPQLERNTALKVVSGVEDDVNHLKKGEVLRNTGGPHIQKVLKKRTSFKFQIRFLSKPSLNQAAPLWASS